MTLITFLYSRIIKLIVDSDNIFKGGNSMASSSIFIYELRSPSEINVESIYSCLKGYPEDENTYFNLEMISANELLGEYVIVQNVQESYYNPEQRVFEYRIVPKANAETRTVTLDVTISPLEDDSQKYKVSIRHEGMSESKQFVTLLDEMIQEDSEQAVFGLKRITLASLLKAHKVDFFDDFGVYTHKEWKLTDIINVTVNKDEKSIDDENDVTTSGEIDASEPSGRLSGISSAILKGDGLRNNDFVKECMSQGFIFSSMSYKFSHKTLPITIVIDVNFKQTDLKINIVKTYQLEDDGIERLAPLPSSDQSLYIDYFQNVAYAVYSNLIEKQKDELVKQTIKPEK